MKRLLIKLLTGAMLTLLLAGTAAADILLTRGDGGAAFPVGGADGYDAFVVSWTQSETTSNTTIRAFNLISTSSPLLLFFDLYGTAAFDPVLEDGWVGTINLTGQVNSERADILVPDDGEPYTANVFSGLTLGPGSYFLFARVQSGEGEWLGGGQGSVAAGFAFSGDYFSPLEDENFLALTEGPSVQIDGTVQLVPEPATTALTGAGLALLAAVLRRRRA